MNYGQRSESTDKFVRKRKCPNCSGNDLEDAGNLRVLGKIIKSYKCRECGARST